MGLLHEMATISYNQTKAQQIKAEKDKQKQLEEDLKKDVKRLLKYGFDLVYNNDYDFLYVYNSKEHLVTGVYNDILSIENELGEQKYNCNYYDTFDYIEEQFEKEFDKFKREKEKSKKLQQEQEREKERQNRKNAKGLSLKDIPLAYKSLALSIILDKATKNWNKPRKY